MYRVRGVVELVAIAAGQVKASDHDQLS